VTVSLLHTTSDSLFHPTMMADDSAEILMIPLQVRSELLLQIIVLGTLLTGYSMLHGTTVSLHCDKICYQWENISTGNICFRAGDIMSLSLKWNRPSFILFYEIFGIILERLRQILFSTNDSDEHNYRVKRVIRGIRNEEPSCNLLWE
jgi:hypothetical protein